MAQSRACPARMPLESNKSTHCVLGVLWFRSNHNIDTVVDAKGFADSVPTPTTVRCRSNVAWSGLVRSRHFATSIFNMDVSVIEILGSATSSLTDTQATLPSTTAPYCVDVTSEQRRGDVVGTASCTHTLTSHLTRVTADGSTSDLTASTATSMHGTMAAAAGRSTM